MDQPCSRPLLDATPFPSFSRLLSACSPFAELTGGRYTKAMFSDMSDEFGKRVRSQAAPAVKETAFFIACGERKLEMLRDVRTAETMIAREAVFMSMVATCKELDLWPAITDLKADDITYNDTTEPLEHIAHRLFYFLRWRAAAGEDHSHRRRMLAATFVVEFCKEHGLESVDVNDSVSEKMLMEFLERVKEWGERNQKRNVKPFLELLPPSLKEKAETWWRTHWKDIAVGAALFLATMITGIGVWGVLATRRASNSSRYQSQFVRPSGAIANMPTSEGDGSECTR